MNPQPTTKELLDELRGQGMKRAEIAAKLGVTLSQVKRWIAAFGVVQRHSKVQEKANSAKRSARERPRYSNPEEGETLMEMAQVILGRRLGEDYRGYLLDGVPTNTPEILKAAGLRLGRRTTVSPSDRSSL